MIRAVLVPIVIGLVLLFMVPLAMGGIGSVMLLIVLAILVPGVACALAYSRFGTRLHGWCAMAKNTGNGSRIGAVLDRFQMYNKATGKFVIFSVSTGKVLRNKKSPGPAKGIRVRPPKKSGGRF